MARFRVEAGGTLAEAGRSEEARGLLREVLETEHADYLDPIDVARAFSALDDQALALDSLERAAEEHSSGLHWIPASPRFDNVRANPRYRQLLERLDRPACRQRSSPRLVIDCRA